MAADVRALTTRWRQSTALDPSLAEPRKFVLREGHDQLSFCVRRHQTFCHVAKQAGQWASKVPSS